ncbi:MAG: CDP-alcohol phosphatidyltransferase family protein [Bacteroidales bacterium]|nr:CDP-alcohol phosphatidyltransferase family protein [Bacteroidales bacterium]
MHKEQSKRIQTSILNSAEKKVLVWLASRQPKWMTSDILTFIGVLGAIMAAVGYALSNYDIRWLWFASFGFFVNWYGDSLDGTLARVRGTQRPVYGFYLDHCIDGITMAIMCVGAGLSDLLNLYIAMAVLVVYLLLSISVYINAHLKGEFKLTYAGMGPTEFRIIMIIVNTLFIYIAPLREYALTVNVLGTDIILGSFDFVGLAILFVLVAIHLSNFAGDAKAYSKIDPLKAWDGKLR